MTSKNQNLFANVRNIVARGIICMLLFAAVGCERTKEEPMNIPITVYSLDGIDCFWEVLFYDFDPKPNEIAIINNSKELEEYIICRNDAFPPAIDFSKYTLLLASGITPCCSVAGVDAVLFQTGARKYTLKVNVLLGALAMPQRWAIGILTPKIPNNANITLKVEFKMPNAIL